MTSERVDVGIGFVLEGDGASFQDSSVSVVTLRGGALCVTFFFCIN